MNGFKLFNKISISTILIAFFYLMAFSANALTTVNVKNGISGVAVTSYRYVIEEDRTYNVVPGKTCALGGPIADYDECLSLHFHRSYMPVIAQGRYDPLLTDWAALIDPTKRYYISILPDQASGQNIGGAQVAIGQVNVDVILTTVDLPTAQIRIFIFNDVKPTNGTPGQGELGLDGFSIILEDAGGRYGISGQQINTDVYGNPLGTTYLAGGGVDVMGNGVILTKNGGIATIKNLAPAKYGIRAVPPTGSTYIQTSTIEGTQTIDAWVKADEPPFFAEFGPPGPHVFMGFVTTGEKRPAADLGTSSISGTITAIHNSRPPEFTFFPGKDVPRCMVALTNLGPTGDTLYVTKCDPNTSNYTIPNIKAGTYTLAIWDIPLNYIFASTVVTVGAGNQILNQSIFAWFAHIEQEVFFDADGNGIRGNPLTEPGIPDVATAIRWRDGTIYQSYPTDTEGKAPYAQVFPFFSWLVAEVDFSVASKATGVTVTVDGGGVLAPGQVLNPQPQVGGGTTRTQTGEVLTQAFQGFLGQTNLIQWGKGNYGAVDNGGISGIVYYAATRAENNPELAAAEVWEPGIPRIQVELYQATPSTAPGASAVITDVNGSGGIDKADVDNFPFTWFQVGGVMGPEDIDNHPLNDLTGNPFDSGDAVQITTTDSWDDSVPTGCVTTASSPPFLADGTYPTDCFDGLRNFNQVRPGVFDGGYAFSSSVTGGATSGGLVVTPLPVGRYIVAVGTHKSYKIVKEEDKNVGFGANFVQPPPPPIVINKLPPECVGTRAGPVPNAYSLFGGTSPYLTEASLATPIPPLCNEKFVILSGQENEAADFFLFTDVPIAGHVMGFILNDIANEFDPNAPTFGEKYAPPYLPVSVRDWQGNEVGRTYSDRWGTFNALVPSTFTQNIPSSSGMSPNMLTACMNDPGPIKNNLGAMVIDPFYQKQYSQFCYTFNYIAGATTYLDTPVVPIAAFAGIGQNALDCEYQDGTPVIMAATTATVAGPIVAAAGGILRITSPGISTVVNPESTVTGQPATITRNYGFGTAMGQVTINGEPVPVATWGDTLITVAIPKEGNLQIIRADGKKTQTGIHVSIGTNFVVVPANGSIQATISSPAVTSGMTVIVPPGTYNEMVIMHKPIKLQGAGASTIINAANIPSTKLRDWDIRVRNLANDPAQPITLLPRQVGTPNAIELTTLFTEAGAGVIVLAKNARPGQGGFGKVPVLDANGNPIVIVDPETGEDVELKVTVARIDGLSITGSDNGGGIMVNGYANDLEISNNRVYGNFGVYSGGIRVGHPLIINMASDNFEDALNYDIWIHHNYISGNGGGNGSGGGISMNHGSKSYQITDNYICGNFTSGNGGGIGHLGLGVVDPLVTKKGTSVITNNQIIFNQSFSQMNVVSGGGIHLEGAASIAAGLNQAVTLGNGTGKVLIDSNLIQGNNAGSGSGGGISLNSINGSEIARGFNNWYSVTITNNIITNNVAGFAGGGISLLDAARINIVNNTVHHNDSSGTSGLAFCDINGINCDFNLSTPRPAGIVSNLHTGKLATAIASVFAGNQKRIDKYGLFSNPRLVNNIIWKNRAFHFAVAAPGVTPAFTLVLDGTDDYGVLGGLAVLNPRFSILTVTTGTDPSNSSTAPTFLNAYFNTSINQTVLQQEFTTLLDAQPAFDEGRNFIDMRFGPLSLTLPRDPADPTQGSNYHLAAPTPIIGTEEFMGSLASLDNDYDGDARSAPIDIGADQFNGAALVNNGVVYKPVTATPAGALVVQAGNKAIATTTTADTSVQSDSFTGRVTNFFTQLFKSFSTETGDEVGLSGKLHKDTEPDSSATTADNDTVDVDLMADQQDVIITLPVDTTAQTHSKQLSGIDPVITRSESLSLSVIPTQSETEAKKAAIAQRHEIVRKAKADAKKAAARKAAAKEAAAKRKAEITKHHSADQNIIASKGEV